MANERHEVERCTCKRPYEYVDGQRQPCKNPQCPLSPAFKPAFKPAFEPNTPKKI